jgi:hypothetical protein
MEYRSANSLAQGCKGCRKRWDLPRRFELADSCGAVDAMVKGGLSVSGGTARRFTFVVEKHDGSKSEVEFEMSPEVADCRLAVLSRGRAQSLQAAHRQLASPTGSGIRFLFESHSASSSVVGLARCLLLLLNFESAGRRS